MDKQKNKGKYESWELEHQAFIFLSADKKSKGRLRAVVEDCSFRNGVGDGVHVHINADATIKRIYAEDVFRGAISVTGGNSIVFAENIEARGSKHVTGVDVEVDGLGYGDIYHVDVTMKNILLEGDCDIAVKRGDVLWRKYYMRGATLLFRRKKRIN